jgi:hypothetical protein
MSRSGFSGLLKPPPAAQGLRYALSTPLLHSHQIQFVRADVYRRADRIWVADVLDTNVVSRQTFLLRIAHRRD